MGEAQWFQPTVRNRLSQAVVLANFVIKYGKFYDISEYPHHILLLFIDEGLDNPYNETVSAQGTKITSKEQFEWGHSGRESSPSGTEGSFEIHLDGTGEKIAEIYWDCPWSGSNEINKNYVKDGYLVSVDGFSIPSGALGKGTISVLED